MQIDLAKLVKPLVFAADEYPDCMTAGNYDIWQEGHGYQVYFWSVVQGDPHRTLEAAQAAANADHAARVIAALDEEALAEVTAIIAEALRNNLDEWARRYVHRAILANLAASP